jgi:hypothetical protein
MVVMSQEDIHFCVHLDNDSCRLMINDYKWGLDWLLDLLNTYRS